MKAIIKSFFIVWALPMVLLALTWLDLPYGYYTFLRLIITASSAFIIWLLWNYQREQREIWSVYFVILALLYNPFIPVQLPRDIWLVINMLTLAFYVANIKCLWTSKKQR